MPEKKKTQPGSMDDNAQKRARDNEKKKRDQLDKLFNDNKSGRPQHPDGQGQ